MSRAGARAQLPADPGPRGPGCRTARGTPDDFATVAIGLISGRAMQALIDPDALDIGVYTPAVKRIIAPLAARGTLI